ncbi:MAG TPA: MBL fold metallo-hydrolase [Thermomicrobiales bacterium]|nr:MBL fold metallo-hydrolase [Thermomicrobiales bacterium]
METKKLASAGKSSATSAGFRTGRGEASMLIEILGSGGADPAPRPGCHCPTCEVARERGIPYARTGPSTFVHGANILFDTPEETRGQLNRAGIDRVTACFYSHWHPDHVMGRRVFELLNWDVYGWPPRLHVTDVYLPEQVAVDFEAHLGGAEHFSYLEQIGVVRVHEVRDGTSVTVEGVTVTPIRLAESYVYAFFVEHAGTRVLIAPDELVGWSPPAWLEGLDLAVLPMGICEHDPFTGERKVHEDHPILQLEMTFPETIEVVRGLRPTRAVLTHIEEADDPGPDILNQLAAMHQEGSLPITFAHDTMRIEVGPA